MILPGLTGNINDSYINNIAKHASSQFQNVCIYNYRLMSRECNF